MSNEQNPQTSKSHVFRGFLVGVPIGFVFGLLASQVWGGLGPYRAQILAGFWGLVGGMIGAVIGFVYRFVKRG